MSHQEQENKDSCLAGDSRAVLCRNGQAIPLTDDHKAAREDETVGFLAPHSSLRKKTLLDRPKCVFLTFGCKIGVRSMALDICSLVDSSKWAKLGNCFGVPSGCHTTVFIGSICILQARVEAAGGHILYWNGVRVMGVLAVSRAIGDHCLRPFVIAEPEVISLVPDSSTSLLKPLHAVLKN